MPLVDTGLIARYYFDEAGSGTTPTTVEDASSNNYDLTEINYGAGNMAYTEITGNRGLESTSTTGTQRARRAIDNTSDALRDALAGVQKATIEVVLRADAFTTNASRIFGVQGRAGQNGTFILKSPDATTPFALTLSWEDGNIFILGDNDLPNTRTVVHIVVDTTQVNTADRIAIYFDGVDQNQETLTGMMAQNDTLTIPSDVDLIALNRESTGSFDRSFDGVLFYAAIYAHAFSAANVTTNFDILTLDDDTPAGAPATLSGRLSLLGAGV